MIIIMLLFIIIIIYHSFILKEIQEARINNNDDIFIKSLNLRKKLENHFTRQNQF